VAVKTNGADFDHVAQLHRVYKRTVIRLNYTAVSEVIRALLDFLSGLNVASDAGEDAL